MLTITSPYVQIADLNGDPLDDGSVYIGTAGLNAETNPITVYWDAAGTQPAAQPIKTRSGVVARNGSPARIYTSAAAYSITVRDKVGQLLASELSVSSSVDASGITDGTITEVKLDAALAAKINGALQKTGGTMTGAITLPGNATNALEAVPKQQLEASVAPFYGHNRIINGTFAVNQESFAGGSRTAGQYGHDMWKAGSGGATYTVSGETATITAGTLVQVIEGANVPEGGTYTLSWTGTAQARVDSGSYAASPITVTGKTAGINTSIEFGTGTVSKVQYESGSSATTFDRQLYQAELIACRHYFQTVSGMSVITYTGGTQNLSFPVSFTPMRATPTATGSATFTSNWNSFGINVSSNTSFNVAGASGGAGLSQVNFSVTLSARL